MIYPRTVRNEISDLNEGRKGNPPEAAKPIALKHNGILPYFVLAVNLIYTSRLKVD